MTITVGKYRLGSPTAIQLDQNTNAPVDLGSSMGGVTLTFKPTVFKAVPDQVIGPVAAWRTQMEASIEMSLPELSVQKLLAAKGFDPIGGVSTIATGTLGAISAPTAVINGTPGATSYTYKVFAYTSNGDGIPVAVSPVITTGPATLTSVNSITINWTAVTGAIGYGVERTVGGPSQGLLQRVPAGILTLTDTGLAATTYSESVVQPTYPNYDTGYTGSTISMLTHRLDLVIPKNVAGSTLNWRWTFWKVLPDGEVQIDWKRDKNSEYKVQMACLMDTTQAAGQEFYKLVEEY